ncbi:MAG TPA: hypothetical protein GXX58_07120, partial [Gelria sp.]|nr:hypothetical protein [Gelria sp.]
VNQQTLLLPTPEGSTEWQEAYKDCAKTYYYEPGQAEITFPVNLFNQGEKAITDFKAVWFNSSKVNPKPWDSPVWEAKEIDRHGGGHNPNTEKPVASPNAGGTGEATTQPEPGIKLAKGESKTFEVTVPLPVPDYAGGKLVFLCNTDGKTPASETNKENNMMIIKIEEAGVDIEAKLPDQPQIYLIDPGQTANVFVTLIVRRNDDGTKPVDTDINYSGPFGSVDKQATFTSMNSNYYDIKFSLTQPGKYYVKASAWPVGVTDIKPENNEDQCLIVVKFKEPPKTQPTKTDSDSNTRVNLRS